MARDSLGTRAGDVSHARPQRRHWCPVSEPYTTVEVLLGNLGQGWTLDEMVVTETHFFDSHQRTAIYFFILWSDDAHLCIPVVANPAVLRVVKNYGLTVTEGVGRASGLW